MLNKATNSALSIYSSFNTRHIKGKVFHGEAISFLKRLRTNTVSVIFLDPPFNLGKDYGNGKSHDRKPHSQYMLWLFGLIIQCERILKQGGSLYIYHLPVVATQLTELLNKHFLFRHWIAVSMKNTFVRGNWLYPAHYALLYYTKGIPEYFQRPKLVPTKCKKCGEYIKDYGGYRDIIDKKGINLSDIWDDISPVRHNNRKSRISNELPMILLERIISISGSPKQLYVDPFAGGGNGVLAALRAGMRFSACDISEEYCCLVSHRIEEAIAELGRR